MKTPVAFLISGIVFGLTAGITPGPLLTLVISETIKHSLREGIKIAISPLITDLPIISISLLILLPLSNFKSILGAISILGGFFICYLAYESFSIKGVAIDYQNIKPHSLKKGVITNFLNPYPYMFWITVGAPIILKAFAISTIALIFFILGFYICLVASMILISIIVEKSKNFLRSQYYLYIIRFLGFVLLIFAMSFFIEGLKFLGFLEKS